MRHTKELVIIFSLISLSAAILFFGLRQISSFVTIAINVITLQNSDQRVVTTPKSYIAPTDNPFFSTTPFPTTRTPRQSVTNTKKSVINPADSCPGVYYNNQCYEQYCIDLDAPGLHGYDGDQYATKSSIVWLNILDKTQYQNTDYCNENGNVVEHFCIKKDDQNFEATAINVTDSRCVDGHSVYN